MKIEMKFLKEYVTLGLEDKNKGHVINFRNISFGYDWNPWYYYNKEILRKLATFQKIILKNSHSFKKF